MTSPASLAQTLVRRVGSALGGATMSRRSLFARTAVVGSALALDPVGYAVRPASAYGSVCGDDANCADGFSVFCCTINNGGNFCPDGAFLGGWWKADNSGFCCGGPRYYLDCNATCGSGWTCTCEDSPDTCDHRKIACNQFRYGQCNLEIDCYGPVVCRLVTCTPPWVFDTSCNSTLAQDDSTANHSAPCLPGECPSPLVLYYYDLGGPGGFLGAQIGAEQQITGGSWLQLQNGGVFQTFPWGTHYCHGPIWAHVEAMGGPTVVGVPTQDDAVCSDGVGLYNEMVHGSGTDLSFTAVYWNPTVGAGSVTGAARSLWIATGYENGGFGYPVSDRLVTSDRTSHYTNFAKVVAGRVIAKGAIYENPRLGTHGVWGPIYSHWKALGFENGPLGYPTSLVAPTSDRVGRYATFTKLSAGRPVDHGAIYDNPATGTFSVHGAIFTKWQHLNYENGPLGYPTSDPQTTADRLAQKGTFAKVVGSKITARSAIYAHETLGTWAVEGALFTGYLAQRSEQGPLGYPTADAVAGSVGPVPYREQQFERGALFDSARGHGVALWGNLLAAYLEAGGPQGTYGLPLTSQSISGSTASATFVGGTLSVSI